MNADCVVGVDVGGTFTDFVLVDPTQGATWFHKRLTQTAEPSEGVVQGVLELLEKAGKQTRDIGTFVTGTTLGSNAILERNGAITALITTEGFTDLLDMGTEQRYDIHDLFIDFPEPLVPRSLRFPVPERRASNGEALVPIDSTAVATIIDRLAGVDSVAVCLINSYASGEHERLVGQAIARAYPTLPVSLSHRVSPEMREYFRFSTTVINAYIAPVLSTYLSELQTKLREHEVEGRLLCMLSSGANLGMDAAADIPVRTLESGPAGGVMSCSHVARTRGESVVMAFDMGGTTAKASLIIESEPLTVPRFEVGRTKRFKPGSGFPVQTPTLDILEVSGGGGSIAHIDQLGLLRVGPDSAGADPGPACYGLGGNRPTLTDALGCLGYLPEYLLGGGLRLDFGLAQQAIETHVGRPLGVSVNDAAWGIYEVVVEAMASALRIHCAERGVDPRVITLMATGGAGPAVAAAVARSLGCTRVVIPLGAGVTSAHGFLRSPTAYETSRSLPTEIGAVDWPTVNGLYESMIDEARLTLGLGSNGEGTYDRSVDVSLVGQAHELLITLPEGETLGPNLIEKISDSYGAMYRTRYGMNPPDRPLQVVTWRLRLRAPSNAAEDLPIAFERKEAAADKQMARTARFGSMTFDVPVFLRSDFMTEAPSQGPAIIEDVESTIVVPPGWTIRVEASGDVLLERNQDSGGKSSDQ